MKKLIILLLFCFIISGSNNTLSFDFNDEINTKVEVSFTAMEFKEHSNIKSEDVSKDIDAMINDARTIVDSYNESFIQKKFENKGDKYQGEFEYTYTYNTFKDNAIFTRCFETSVIDEDEKNIYVYLKGESICAPFTMKVKADGRMINNNASKIKKGTYIWSVEENNNDIYFNISKEKVSNSSSITSHAFSIILLFIIIGALFFIKKKNSYNY